MVTIPFLLDFAGTSLDFPKEFTEDAQQLWWEGLRERFGDDFHRAEDVFYGLIDRFGIYYYDLKPGNLSMR